ncbi:MAG TPA: 4-oxalocrotonate tautomerase family protein [Ramlibacter sp.]|nr:4-oxalocrotonate tautomerase family protein [Ramlibacter sp.]
MPILNVKVSRPAHAELTREISRELLELTSRILRKPREVTSIAIDYVPPEHWVIAGRTLVEHGKSSFYFDIKVTDGTNTKDEMAQYVAESFAAFQRILGDVHDESYVYVEEVHASAYGYGGRTQEFRYVQSAIAGGL